MNELFDYGDARPFPSIEVAAYEIEEELINTDWRQRAHDHFRKVESGEPGDSMGPAIGALTLALSSERTARSRSAEIEHWETRLLLEHGSSD